MDLNKLYCEAFVSGYDFLQMKKVQPYFRLLFSAKL